MFLRRSQEDLSMKNQKLLRELEISLNKLKSDVEANFKEMGMTRDELDGYLANPDNFTSEEWEDVVRLKGEMEQRLSLDERQLSNAEAVKEARANLPRNKDWICVR